LFIAYSDNELSEKLPDLFINVAYLYICRGSSRGDWIGRILFFIMIAFLLLIISLTVLQVLHETGVVVLDAFFGSVDANEVRNENIR